LASVEIRCRCCGKYWKVLKGRLAKEGSELVTNCYQLKMEADDAKQRLTEVAVLHAMLAGISLSR
jgi:DNA-damage-inducible protein D